MSTIRRIPLWRPDRAATMRRAGNDAFITETPEPELHVFPADPDANTGIAAVICPGGGYAGVALGPEGHACAAWLASAGITGMVLQYRLPGGSKTAPYEDIQLAFKYARNHAESLGFSPGRLGVIGFSAGGHLASLASTMYAETPENTRPDFTVLFYPVISMEENKKGMTRLNLLGKTPSPDDIAAYSSDRLVNENTPPAILFLCDDDPLVPPRQSLLYYGALKRHGIPASMHIFPEGGHAWGFRGANMDGAPFRYDEAVRVLLLDWLEGVTG